MIRFEEYSEGYRRHIALGEENDENTELQAVSYVLFKYRL